MSFAQTETVPSAPESLSAAASYGGGGGGGGKGSSSASPSLPSPPLGQSAPTFNTLVFRQFVGGSIGGMLLVLSGHPLDTIKTRMQAGEYNSMGAALRGAVLGRVSGGGGGLQKEAVLPIRQRVASLYRGASLLVCLQGFYSATLFGFNGIVRFALTPQEELDYNRAHNIHAPQQPVSRVLAAAVITAPIHTALMTPMDVVKVRLQAMHKSSDYKGPMDCIKAMVRGEGAASSSSSFTFRSMFAGYTAFSAVRMVGFGPYFVTFELVKNFLTQSRRRGDGAGGVMAEGGGEGVEVGLLRKDNPMVPIIGGALAGVAYWCAAFPLDTIKTTLQLSRSPMWDGHARRAAYYQSTGKCATTAAPPSPPPMRYAHALRYILTDGHRHAHYNYRLLYRGFSVAFIRSMPANGAMFFGVKETEKFMINNGW